MLNACVRAPAENSKSWPAMTVKPNGSLSGATEMGRLSFWAMHLLAGWKYFLGRRWLRPLQFSQAAHSPAKLR